MILNLYINNCALIFDSFAPGNVAEKCTLRLVEQFSGQFFCYKELKHTTNPFKAYTLQPSDPDIKYFLAKLTKNVQESFLDLRIR